MAGPAQARMAAVPAKDSVFPFAASLAFTLILLLVPEASVPGFGRLRLAFLTGVFAIAAQCWIRFAAGRPPMRLTRETWLAGALLAWVIITLPLSKQPDVSTALLGDVVKALGVFWLLSNTVTTLGRLRTMVWALSLTSMPLAAISVWEFLSHRVRPIGDPGSGRIAGYSVAGYQGWLTGDPNQLAMMLNLILPLAIALFFIDRRPAARSLLAGIIALDASAIVVTFSRGGFLTLAITLILYLRTLYKWRERRWVFAALVLAVAAVPLLPRAYLDRLDTLTHVDTEASAAQRWESIRYGVPYVLSHPLPVGLGMNSIVLGEARASEAQGVHVRIDDLWRNECPQPCFEVHNTYLDFAIELGWLGLGLFLLLLVGCVKIPVRVRERCASVPGLRELSVLAEGIRLALVASAVAAFFFPWTFKPPYFYYFAGLAVAVGAVYEEARTAEAPAAPPRLLARHG